VRRSRTLGIDPFAAIELRRWLEARPARGFDARAPLFCSRTGKAVTTGYLRRLLPGLARHTGILKRVHAHGLRHTHTSELRTEGVDIAIISRQLGHVSIATTCGASTTSPRRP
jgi:site-specific recombinase XerD